MRKAVDKAVNNRRIIEGSRIIEEIIEGSGLHSIRNPLEADGELRRKIERIKGKFDKM